MQRLIFNERLDKWGIVSKSTYRNSSGDKYLHLMIDPDTAGEEDWNTIIGLMPEHLEYKK